MSGVLITLRLPDGRRIEGRIQGSGGELGADLGVALASSKSRVAVFALRGIRARVRTLIARAETGTPFGALAYEPRPGHVKFYVGSSIEIIPLAAARVIRVAPPNEPTGPSASTVEKVVDLFDAIATATKKERTS